MKRTTIISEKLNDKYNIDITFLSESTYSYGPYRVHVWSRYIHSKWSRNKEQSVHWSCLIRTLLEAHIVYAKQKRLWQCRYER